MFSKLQFILAGGFVFSFLLFASATVIDVNLQDMGNQFDKSGRSLQQFRDEPRVDSFMQRDSLKYDDITIATHLTVDRIPTLKRIMETWRGPMSVCVYFKDLLKEYPIWEEFIREGNFHPLRLQWASYSTNQELVTYPANILRNRALRQCKTNLVLLLDADFVPDAALYDALLSRLIALNRESRNRVWVLPAFEFTSPAALEHGMPAGRHELIERMDRGEMQGMYQKAWSWVHMSTINYTRWQEVSEDYEVEYKVQRWEPYLLMSVQHIPAFDERYIYFGNDKVEHVYHLHHRGFRFIVMADHFIVHFQHDQGEWAKPANRDKTQSKVIWMFEDFKRELDHLESGDHNDPKHECILDPSCPGFVC